MKLYMRKFVVVSCLLSFGAVYGAHYYDAAGLSVVWTRHPKEIEKNSKIKRLCDLISKVGNEKLEFFQNEKNMHDFLNVVRVLSHEECDNFFDLLTDEGVVYLQWLLKHNSDQNIENVGTLKGFISFRLMDAGMQLHVNSEGKLVLGTLAEEE